MHSIVGVLPLLLLALGHPQPTSAQHPRDSSAVLIDSFVVAVEMAPLEPTRSPYDFDLSALISTTVEETVRVWRTTSGIDLVGEVSSIAANGDGIDRTTTRELVMLLSDAAVDEAIARGHLGPDHVTTTVHHARCVLRSGIGPSTRFAPLAPHAYLETVYTIAWMRLATASRIGMTNTSDIDCGPAGDPTGEQ